MNKTLEKAIIVDLPLIGTPACARKHSVSVNEVNYIKSKHKIYIPKYRKCYDAEDYSVNHVQFCEIDTKLSAYLLGLIWSDGHVSKKTNSIVFSTTDPDFNHFNPHFQKSGKWGVHLKKRAENEKTAYSIFTTNKYLKDFLSSVNFIEKEKGVGPICNLIPQEFLHLFILGVVDGDGGFYYNQLRGNYRFSIASSITQDWTFFINLFNSLNLPHRIERSETVHGNYSKLHVSGKFNVKRLGEWLYRSQNEDLLGLPRKYEKYLAISEQCKVRTGPKPKNIIHNHEKQQTSGSEENFQASSPDISQ